MNEILFEVLGHPHHQQRHRTVRMGKFNKNYDPSAGDKADFLSMVQQYAPDSPILNAVLLEVTFKFPRPATHYGTGKNINKLKLSAPEHHLKRPDCDNLVKFIMDALSGVYWKNDSQIIKLDVYKTYTERTPKTIISIKEIQ